MKVRDKITKEVFEKTQTISVKEIPNISAATAKPIEADTWIDVEENYEEDHYYTFTPTKSGKYTILRSENDNTNEFCYVFNLGKLRSSNTINVTAGQKYTFRIYPRHDSNGIGKGEKFLFSSADKDGVALIHGETKETLTSKTSKLKVGETLQLEVTGKYQAADSNKQGIRWSSSNPSVATIDENGKITPTGAGRAYITMTYDLGLAYDLPEKYKVSHTTYLEVENGDQVFEDSESNAKAVEEDQWIPVENEATSNTDSISYSNDSVE